MTSLIDIKDLVLHGVTMVAWISALTSLLNHLAVVANPSLEEDSERMVSDGCSLLAWPSYDFLYVKLIILNVSYIKNFKES